MSDSNMCGIFGVGLENSLVKTQRKECSKEEGGRKGEIRVQRGRAGKLEGILFLCLVSVFSFMLLYLSRLKVEGSGVLF